MTELHLGSTGIHRIDGEALKEYALLECLWLNGNKISRVIGLEHSWRLKELYLHDNAIISIISPSCSLWHLKHLELLDLSNNLLQGLTPTLEALQTKLNLTSLNLSGNPLCFEALYRLTAIHKLKSLKIFDCLTVTNEQREEAKAHFLVRSDPRPMAFGGRVEPFTPLPLVKGKLSATEALLASQVAVNRRRQERQEAERHATSLREAARPAFDYSFRVGSMDATLTSKGKDPASSRMHKDRGAPTRSSAFEFVPRGRVPALRIKAGPLMLSERAVDAAAKAAGSFSSGPVQVYISFSDWGSLRQPVTSRTIDTSVYRKLPANPNAELVPNLRTDEELISASAAYERLTQLMETGPEDKIAISATLCEATTGRALASSRLSVADLVRCRGHDRSVSAVLVLAPKNKGLRGDEPFATVDVSILSDWGTSRGGRPVGCLPKAELPPAVVDARARARNLRDLKDFVAFSTWSKDFPPEPAPGSLPQGLSPRRQSNAVPKFISAI